jgi:hypothetical protein
MKKTFLIILLLYLTNSFSQEERKTIYISYDFFRLNIVNDSYFIYFTINRQGQKNRWDNYRFFTFENIMIDGVKDLKSLSIEIDSEKEIEILKQDYFKERDFCDIHNELSEAKIYIIKKLNSPKGTFKYKVWAVYYDGTNMNVSFINSDTFENVISDKPKRRL